jgi:predicted Zn-dependent protease
MSLNLVRLDRRALVRAAMGGLLVTPLIACNENPATGRRQFIVVSDEMLEQMSAQTWAEIQRTAPRSQSAAAQRTIETIGKRIADSSGLSNVNWEFVAFDSPEVNAFVLPGGKVGFFRGLMERAESDDELAAVMGHEVGHVIARHAAERVSQQLGVQLGVQAAAMALSEDLGEHADLAAAALGAGLIYGVVLPYSRAHELEADRLGVDLMKQSAFDPGGAVSFWEKMIAAQGETPLAWMSTHPANDDRLAALRALI